MFNVIIDVVRRKRHDFIAYVSCADAAFPSAKIFDGVGPTKAHAVADAKENVKTYLLQQIDKIDYSVN